MQGGHATPDYSIGVYAYSILDTLFNLINERLRDVTKHIRHAGMQVALRLFFGWGEMTVNACTSD